MAVSHLLLNLLLKGMVQLNIQLSAFACTGQGSPFHQLPRERLPVFAYVTRGFSASPSSKAVSFLSGCLPLKNSLPRVAFVVGGLSSPTFCADAQKLDQNCCRGFHQLGRPRQWALRPLCFDQTFLKSLRKLSTTLPYFLVGFFILKRFCFF